MPDPADVDPDADPTMAREGRKQQPICPECGSDLRWQTGNTLGCQRCGYSTGPDR